MGLPGAQQNVLTGPKQYPAWSDFIAETSLCQAVGELPCWSQLHSSLANSGF